MLATRRCGAGNLWLHWARPTRPRAVREIRRLKQSGYRRRDVDTCGEGWDGNQMAGSATPEQAQQPLCRDVELPGVYLVALGDGTAARFVDNRYGGIVADDGEADAHVTRSSDAPGSWKYDPAQPPPPWSDLDIAMYRNVETLPVDAVDVVSTTTASPFGDLHLHTRYEDGRPTYRKVLDPTEVDTVADDAQVVLARRLSCVLLHRAGVVDLLGSLRGGNIAGDWPRLMLLAGVVEAPGVVSVHDRSDARHQLIALALFAEAFAHRVDDALR